MSISVEMIHAQDPGALDGQADEDLAEAIRLSLMRGGVNSFDAQAMDVIDREEALYFSLQQGAKSHIHMPDGTQTASKVELHDSSGCIEHDDEDLAAAIRLSLELVHPGSSGGNAEGDAEHTKAKVLAIRDLFGKWWMEGIDFGKHSNPGQCDKLEYNASAGHCGSSNDCRGWRSAENHVRPEKAQARSMAQPKRTVVLSLDYDNCMDVLFEKVSLRLRRRNMTKELEVMDEVRNRLHQDLQKITVGADRVILMVGSNRQSVYVDAFNRERLQMEIGPVDSDVGWVRHDFQQLAEQKGWELNRVLLADKENNVPPGSAWNNASLQIRSGRREEHAKQSLIQYQLEQLRDIDGHIDFYFFDDNLNYLEFVRRQVSIPPHTHFFIVHFDWFSHIIEQKPMELHAVDTENRPQRLGERRS